MKIVEVFNSIQGEGKFVGRASLFIRTYGCNFSCVWCDTVFKENYKGNFCLLDTIKYLVDAKEKNYSVVLTGGEPLLHLAKKDKDFLMLSSLINDLYSMRLTIETNGSYSPELLKERENIYYSISPKLNSSGNFEDKNSFKKYIKNIKKNFSEIKEKYFKFVFSGSSIDKEDILYTIKELEIKNDDVFIMPKGGLNNDNYKENCLLVYDFVMENGFNYTPRLQVELNLK